MSQLRKEFDVIEGKGGFKIIDGRGVEYGSFAEFERAEFYCQQLNIKWTRADSESEVRS